MHEIKYKLINRIIVVNEGVTSLNSYDFINVHADKVILPNSLKTIEPYTFSNIGLKEVVFNNNLEIIGLYAFYKNKIESIILPNSIKEVGSCAFGLNNIKTLILPSEIETIGTCAFSNNKLETVELPKKITRIEGAIFKDNLLNSVLFKGEVISIGPEAFCGNRLESIELPNSIKSIHKGAFKKNKLNDIKIPDKVTIICKEAFSMNSIKKLYVGDNVVEIDDSAFEYNIIETLTLGKNVESINEAAFKENRIPKLVLPDSLKIIKKNAFIDNKIESIEFSKNLESIGKDAFRNNKINVIEFNEKLKIIEEGAFLNNNIKRIEINDVNIGKDAFLVNPTELVVMKSNNLKLQHNVFNTDKIIINDKLIERKTLNKFGYENIDKIFSFKKYISDYNIDKINKFEFDLLPNDIEVLKNFKSNYKKYITMLEESNIENNTTNFKLAFLLGIFNEGMANAKIFLECILRKEELSLDDIIYNYDISKYNKKLKNIFIEYKNNPIYKEVIKRVLRDYNNIFKIIIKYKKNQVTKSNTEKIKLQKENLNTEEIENILKIQKADIKKLSYLDLISFHKNTAFQIYEENERLKEIVLEISSYIDTDEFDIIQDIYSKRTKMDESFFKNYKGKSGSLEYEWLRSDDPRNFILGYIVDCCAKINGDGEDIMIQSIVNPKIKNLVIKKDGKIVGKTTVYFNDTYLLCNNIEMKSNFNENKEALSLIRNALIEQANHLEVNSVNIGLENNDLINEINESDLEIIRKNLLKNYNYLNYSGDAYSEQVRIL